MTTVNHCLLGAISALLERIELTDGIPFSEFDPDDEDDVRALVDTYVKPVVITARRDNQEALLHSIAYYTSVETAPIQLMKDRCQELTLPDADSWICFFDRVGRILFGDEFNRHFDQDSVVEELSEQQGETLFRPE